MKVGLILHGKKPGQKEIEASFINAFEEDERVVKYTEFPHHAEEIATSFSNHGLELIVVSGGDGSLNDVVNGVLRSNNPAIPISIWPTGTGNDFVKTLPAFLTFDAMRRGFFNSEFAKVDVGKISLSNQSKYFINVTDVGLGGCVAKDMMKSKRLLGSFLTYQLYIIKNLLTYKKKKITFQIDNHKGETTVMNFVIANSPYFGSGLGISPDSDPTDGKFEVVIIGEINLFHYLRFIPKVKRKERIHYHKIHYLSGNKIGIEAESPMPIDMDGEFIGFTPFTIELTNTVNVLFDSL